MVLNIFYSGIEYTKKYWVHLKVRHYPHPSHTYDLHCCIVMQLSSLEELNVQLPLVSSIYEHGTKSTAIVLKLRVRYTLMGRDWLNCCLSIANELLERRGCVSE